LKPNDTYLSAFNSNETMPLLNMFYKQIDCAQEQPRDSDRGRILYFITNIDCDSMCSQVLNTAFEQFNSCFR
jgi:hypothetical protein